VNNTPKAATYYTPESVKKVLKQEISRKMRADQLDLPTLPQVAMKVMGMINQSTVGARELQEAIKHDPKLSARLLKIANSPVYGGVTKITTIQRAVVAVGLNTLRDLLFSVAMGDKVFKSKRFSGLMNKFWKHSLATGYLAKKIARLKGLDSDYAFLCGLLHDIGKPILVGNLDELMRQHEDKIFVSADFIDEVLKEFHQAIGGLIASAWHFPGSLNEAIRFHHDYQYEEGIRQMALLTRVADLFAQGLGWSGYATDPEIDLSREQSLYQFNLFPDEIAALRREGPVEIETFLNSFEMQ